MFRLLRLAAAFLSRFGLGGGTGGLGLGFELGFELGKAFFDSEIFSVDPWIPGDSGGVS
jgi:hypothetical protein